MDTTSYVHMKWSELTADIDKVVQEKWRKVIESHYSKPCRKYHTFLHLYHMLKHVEEFSNEICCQNAIIYAILFHDICYDARAQDNEEESIKVFKEFAEESNLSQKDELVAKVEELIMALKAHCTEEHKVEGLYGTDDVHYFLDFDISILGSDPEEYKKYALQIRDEYDFLPKPKYNLLRSKVLQLFLQIPNIYATKAFRDKYEKQARSNIANEIECLKKDTA